MLEAILYAASYAKTNPSHDQIDNILKEAGAVEVKHNERKYVSYE